MGIHSIGDPRQKTKARQGYILTLAPMRRDRIPMSLKVAHPILQRGGNAVPKLQGPSSRLLPSPPATAHVLDPDIVIDGVDGRQWDPLATDAKVRRTRTEGEITSVSAADVVEDRQGGIWLT